MQEMLISVAIPCYRSENNIESVVQEIKNEFSYHHNYDYQIILINDGSPDHTEEVIKKMCGEDKKIIGVILSRNFTQTNAKMAALPYVKGEVLIYMDDDGQHPARDIFKLAKKIMEGNDVVYAHFLKKRQSRFKIVSSDLFGWISEKMGNKPKGIKTSSFQGYSRFAVDMLCQYQSPAPSMGAYVNSFTTKIVNVESEQRDRRSGISGYNFIKMASMAMMTLTNFTIVPLRIIDGVGIVTAIIGILYGIVLVMRKLIFNTIALGYTSNMVVMLILGGLILIGLGVVGEYVGRVYMLLSNKPQYIIREIINEQDDKQHK